MLHEPLRAVGRQSKTTQVMIITVNSNQMKSWIVSQNK